MSALLNFAKEEYKKTMLQNKIKIMIVFLIISSIAGGILYFFLKQNIGVEIVTAERYPVYILDILNSFILPLFVIVISSDLVTAELRDGTIKNMFALPINKSLIYAGKILSSVLIITMIVTIIGFICVLTSVIGYGMEVLGGIGAIVFSFLGTIAYLSLLLVISTFISLFIASPSTANFINILLWFGMRTVGVFFAPVQRFLPTSYINWYQPLINGDGLNAIIQPLMFMLSYFVIFLVLGILIFEKKDV